MVSWHFYSYQYQNMNIIYRINYNKYLEAGVPTELNYSKANKQHKIRFFKKKIKSGIKCWNAGFKNCKHLFLKHKRFS